MKGTENKNNFDSSSMRRNLKPKFLQRGKGSKSTIIHNLFYKIHIPKGAIIPKHEVYNHNKKLKKTTADIITNKKQEIIESISNPYIPEQKIEKFNLDILKPNYVKPYRKELLNLLLHHTSFYDDMFMNLQELTLLKDYLYKENYKKITQDQEVSIIRFQQLYNKFKVQEEDTDKLKITNILKKTYHVENYIDNLLFAEYINKILGIGDSQTIIINNNIYKLYVSSLQKDMYYGGDIFLEDESGKTIGIDITLYKKAISGKSEIESTYFNDNIIINYKIYREDFESFVKEYKNYILNQGAFPIRESKYTSEQIHEFEQRIDNIINLENNTTSFSDQSRDNNVLINQLENNHNQYN